MVRQLGRRHLQLRIIPFIHFLFDFLGAAEVSFPDSKDLDNRGQVFLFEDGRVVECHILSLCPFTFGVQERALYIEDF